jgi:hypothetical protein
MAFNTPTVSTFLYKIVPFANKALPALNGATEVDANATFNTNIPFGMAMKIRRIQTKWWRSTNDSGHTGTSLLVSQLTEASGATKPTAGDPLALYSDIAVFTTQTVTAVGVRDTWDPTFYRFDYLPPHPGVPTMAQQLNVVLSGNNADPTHTDVSIWVFFMEIYYELVLLDQQLKDYLSNRISLQRVS